MSKKLTYKSDTQVKRHIAKFGPEKAESMAHEKKESPGFEKAEHRLYSSMGKKGKKK